MVIVRTTIRPFGDTTGDPFLHSLRHWVVLILNTSPFHRKHTFFMYVGSFDGRSNLRETGRCLPQSWHIVVSKDSKLPWITRLSGNVGGRRRKVLSQSSRVAVSRGLGLTLVLYQIIVITKGPSTQ